MTAEPRHPALPDGVTPALGRRSAAAVHPPDRRALLLQRMALPHGPGQEGAHGPPAVPTLPTLVTPLTQAQPTPTAEVS